MRETLSVGNPPPNSLSSEMQPVGMKLGNACTQEAKYSLRNYKPSLCLDLLVKNVS